MHLTNHGDSDSFIVTIVDFSLAIQYEVFDRVVVVLPSSFGPGATGSSRRRSSLDLVANRGES